MTRHRRPPPPDHPGLPTVWWYTAAGVFGALAFGVFGLTWTPVRPTVDVTGVRLPVGTAATTVATETTEPLYAPQSVPTVPVQTRRAATTPRPSQSRTAAPVATVAPTIATTPPTTTAEATTTAQTTTAATTTDTTEPTLLPLPTGVLPTELPVETTSEETLP